MKDSPVPVALPLINMPASKRLPLCSVVITLTMVAGSPPQMAHGDSSQAANLSLCNQVVSEWNAANNSASLTELGKLYGAEVLFYGTPLKKQSCLEKKLRFLAKNATFRQSVDQIRAEETALPGEVRCHFDKRVSMDGKTKDYPSYLILRDGKIVTEGDEVTDANLSKRKVSSSKHPKDALSADFNGDGSLEYAWLEAPTINEEGVDCVGECACTLRFSDSSIPPISVAPCIGGSPDDLGDLNKNRSHEIGLSPSWFTSCWSNYYVWTLLRGKWVYAVKPITTYCEQFEKGIKPIEADAREGYVIVRSSEFTGDEIKLISESVPIAR